MRIVKKKKKRNVTARCVIASNRFPFSCETFYCAFLRRDFLIESDFPKRMDER